MPLLLKLTLILLFAFACFCFIFAIKCYSYNPRNITSNQYTVQNNKGKDDFFANIEMYNKKYNAKDYEKYKNTSQYKNLVNAYNQYHNTFLQYSTQVLSSPLYHTKSNSALLGGAASAIGGTAVGVATYLKTEQKNKEIDQHNRYVASNNAKTAVMKEDVIKCMNNIKGLEFAAKLELK